MSTLDRQGRVRTVSSLGTIPVKRKICMQGGAFSLAEVFHRLGEQYSSSGHEQHGQQEGVWMRCTTSFGHRARARGQHA